MQILKISYDSELFNNYDKVACSLTMKIGTKVIVADNSLYKLATVIDVLEENDPVYNTTFVRVATERDLEQNKRNLTESGDVLLYAQDKANNLGLEMRFISSFYTLDRKQLFISYVADSRVDFRELAKVLAQKYKTRIELRQIGVRDRAKKVGGLGPCGLFLCCNQFLTEFASVSINMAKNQFLALNPSKINGLCGRLLCCLNYEDDVYTELKKNLPNIGNLVETSEGLGKVIEVNVFNKTYKVEIKNKGVVELKVNE